MLCSRVAYPPSLCSPYLAIPRHTSPYFRCGVLVELLTYALIVGILAGLVYCTRPHADPRTFVALEAGGFPGGVGAHRGLVEEPGDVYVESFGAY